jgi:hypothetical protein
MGQTAVLVNGTVQIENLSADKPAKAVAFGKVYDARSFKKNPVNAKVISYVRGPEVTIEPASSGNVPLEFELLSSLLPFGHSHYVVQPEILTSGRELWPPPIQIESQAPPSCLFKDAFTRIDNISQGIIHKGQAIINFFQASSNSLRAVFNLRFAGSDVDLHIYDSSNRHVGKNYGTGGIDLEILGAEYVGDSTNLESIIIPTISGATYTVKTVGVDVAGYEHFNVDCIEEITIGLDLLAWPSELYAAGFIGDSISVSGKVIDRSGQHAFSVDSVMLDSVWISSQDTLSSHGWTVTYDSVSSTDSAITYNVNIPLGDSIEPGIYSGFVTVFTVTDTMRVPLQVTVLRKYMRGDVNDDSKVSISDIVYLINYLFKFGPPPQCPPSPYLICGDPNCDGKVSISDIVYLINYLFKFGPPPC